jgi:hypothetical protein
MAIACPDAAARARQLTYNEIDHYTSVCMIGTRNQAALRADLKPGELASPDSASRASLMRVALSLCARATHQLPFSTVLHATFALHSSHNSAKTGSRKGRAKARGCTRARVHPSQSPTRKCACTRRSYHSHRVHKPSDKSVRLRQVCPRLPIRRPKFAHTPTLCPSAVSVTCARDNMLAIRYASNNVCVSNFKLSLCYERSLKREPLDLPSVSRSVSSMG